MDSITIEIPGDIASTMKLPRQRIKEHLLIDIAVSFYQQGILPFGPARKLCNMTKWDFGRELGLRKVKRHYDEKDLDEGIEFAYSSK